MASPASRPRILFLAPRYAQAPTRGDQRRVHHLVEGLARHADVTLLAFGSGDAPDGVTADYVRHTPVAVLTANLRAPQPRLPGQVRLFLDQHMRRALRRELNRRPDVVHITLARMGAYLPPRGPWHRHVDFVDALSLNMASRARASRGVVAHVFNAEARLMRRYETLLAREADSSSLVAEADRRAAPWLRSAAVIPMGADTAAFPFRDPGEDRGETLLFFGNLGYFHNVEPARFVAEEVLPRVRRAVPSATLRIVGARPVAAVKRLARHQAVELAADVPSMAAELHRAAVAIVPMFSGSGMKNKIIEAFCAGAPVVTNRAGVEGVARAEPDRHHLEATDAEGLADACVRLLRAPALRSRLAREARALIDARYTWERQVDALLALYGMPVARPPVVAAPAGD